MATRSARTHMTNDMHISVSRHDSNGFSCVKIRDYELARIGPRLTRRHATILIFDDGFCSGSIQSYDEDGRCIRDAYLDEAATRKIASEYGLWERVGLA